MVHAFTGMRLVIKSVMESQYLLPNCAMENVPKEERSVEMSVLRIRSTIEQSVMDHANGFGNLAMGSALRYIAQ